LFAGIHRQLFEETFEGELDQLLQLLAKLQENAQRVSIP
jgi:hypothetical protein